MEPVNINTMTQFRILYKASIQKFKIQYHKFGSRQWNDIKDNSKEAWEGANLRFYRNCLLRNKDLYGWYDPRRYINAKRAAADYALLGGDICWNAWLAAKEKYNGQSI